MHNVYSTFSPRDLVAQQYLRVGALPASISCRVDKVLARAVDICRPSVSRLQRRQKEEEEEEEEEEEGGLHRWLTAPPWCPGIIKNGTVGPPRRSWCFRSYSLRLSKLAQIKCRPLGMAVMAVTLPEPSGNFSVRVGSPSPLWTLNSSTVPLRRPAYRKFPSVPQQADMHHGGTPLPGCDTAMGGTQRRSQSRSVPSMLAARKVFWSVVGPGGSGGGPAPLVGPGANTAGAGDGAAGAGAAAAAAAEGGGGRGGGGEGTDGA